MIQTFFIDTLDNESRSKLHEFCVDLDSRFKKEGLGDTVYNVVQELVHNAVKANLKRSYFKKNNLRMDDAESYAEGLAAFKASLGTVTDAEWKQAVHELGLRVTVEVDIDETRVLIYVENNAVMIPEEERRLRTQLARAMSGDESGAANMVEFAETYGDESEGAGLGLALVIMLIKDMGFNPEYFRVFTRGGSTVARLEFPLIADYVPIRRNWLRLKGRE